MTAKVLGASFWSSIRNRQTLLNCASCWWNQVLGVSVSGKLVNECVSFARTAGYKKITLWTQSILAGAHRIYQQAGFKLVEEAPHQSFGADLIGQTWDLKL